MSLRQTVARSLPYRIARPAVRALRARLNGPSATSAPAAPPMPVYFPRTLALPEDTPEQRAIVEEVKQHSWYHTIDLGQGIRTPGRFDHIPPLHHYPMPLDLTGKRCLDVATFDGFWAFEMERRGAAEVVALDIDSWLDLDVPPYILEDFKRRGVTTKTGVGFEIAHKVRNSKVDRRICNVYDLSPEKFGEFDFVFCSDVLVHITNPIRALENICAVTKGEAVFVEGYAPGSAGMGPWITLLAQLDNSAWWMFGRDFLSKAALAAGFARVEASPDIDVRQRATPDAPMQRLMLRAINNR